MRFGLQTIPPFLNVFKGDLSLIGLRAERVELAEAFGRGAGAGMFVGVHHQRIALALGHGDRSDLAGERAVLGGGSGTPVAVVV